MKINSTGIGRMMLAGIIGISFFSDSFAEALTPEQARQNVVSFFSQPGQKIRRKASATNLELAYTATSEPGDCFYVFNHPGGGFTIASADDRLPSVLGFSDNGSFDANKIPVNVEWWLGEYRNQIEGFLKENPDVAKYSMRARPIDNAVIEPLCTTKWDQTAPYNNDCPYDSWGRGTSVTGCVATMMAQKMKYHNWPDHPTGMRNGYNFNGTTLRWADMIDDYSTKTYTADQAAAVALLMYQCGVSVDMQYSAWESGAYSNDVQVAMRTYFGYNPSLEMKMRDYYTYSQWNKMVYEELSTNGPVMYCGRSSRGGHAFICDGYLGNNYYHFNWGWGGYQDGYFLLNALNPATGGTGSYAGGYNSDQTIFTGVRPSDGQGQGKLQSMLVSTGSWSYSAGKFVVSDDPSGYNLIYNPLSYPISVTVGVKVSDYDSGAEVKTVMGSGTQSFSTGYGFGNLTLTIPSLPDGKYKVTPLMKTSSGEYLDILVPLKMQTYVTLTVANGKQTFTNEGPSEESLPLLLSAKPQFNKMYANTGCGVRATITNVGDGDFMGTVYLTIMDHNDPFGNTFSAEQWVSIPSHFSADVDFVADNVLKAADYDLYLMDELGNDLIDETIVTVYPSNFSMPESEDLYVEYLEPRFYTISSDGCGVVMQVVNKQKSDATIDFNIEILDASNLQVVRKLSAGNVKVEKQKSTYLNFAKVDLGVEPGAYFWRLTDGSGKLLTPVVPLIVESERIESDGICYVVVSGADKTAMIVAPATSDYTGDVAIPAEIDGLTVVSYKGDTFTFADELTSLSLPASFTEIGNASFYFTESLRSLRLGAQEPPMVAPSAFGPGLPEKIVVSMPEGTANFYAVTDSWMPFIISNWTISCKDGVEITSGLLADPMTGKPYTPYYVSADESLSFICSAPQGMGVKASWTLDNGETGSAVFGKEIKLPTLGGHTASVILTADDGSSVASLFADEDSHYDIWSLDGRLLIKGADRNALSRLSKGIYLVGGRKMILK